MSVSNIATALGLRATSPQDQSPSLTASYLIFHFFFAYAITAARFPKRYYGLDHNVNPREDLAKYGPAAVSSGKITQSQLNRLKRIESCHANSIESFPLFVGAMIWAHVAGLENSVINRSALVYTVVRVVYAINYVVVEREAWSRLRGLMWWTGNVVCCRLFWLGGKAINAKVAGV